MGGGLWSVGVEAVAEEEATRGDSGRDMASVAAAHLRPREHRQLAKHVVPEVSQGRILNFGAA